MISDPFIPNEIRTAVVDLLDNRIRVLGSLYSDEFEKYSNNLAKGKHGPFGMRDLFTDLGIAARPVVAESRYDGGASTCLR